SSRNASFFFCSAATCRNCDRIVERTEFTVWSSLMLAARQCVAPDAGQRCRRRNPVWIDLNVNDCRLPGAARRLEGRRKIACSFDHGAEASEGPRIGRKVGILQAGTNDATRKIALLMHPDCTVARVVEDDNDDRKAILHGSCKFLSIHQKIAIAVHRNDRSL